MIADPGTRCGELYAPTVEVLPEDASDRGAATDLESDRVAVEGLFRDPFVNSREQLETMLGWLCDGETDGLETSCVKP